jgi:hypothetical protein
MRRQLMPKFCIHESHAGICEKTGEYCSEGPCPYEDMVDYAPVRYGKWVHSEIEDDDWGRTFHEWTCSVCGYSVAYNHTGENYCPNCGAKMDKEEADELD